MDREFYKKLDNVIDTVRLQIIQTYIQACKKQAREAGDVLTNMPLSETRLISVLHFNGIQTMAELGKLSIFSYTNLSKTVKGLEESGYVKRNVLPENRRFVQIDLTEKGHELIMAYLDVSLNGAIELLSNNYNDDELIEIESHFKRLNELFNRLEKKGGMKLITN
ncbi:MAG: winged helix DNA-binding protein [Clostridia bacterium]